MVMFWSKMLLNQCLLDDQLLKSWSFLGNVGHVFLIPFG
ncbi:hypothetical protein SPJ2_1771 [Streptococcus parauberis KRS-02109]|nr:hypothetical protein SPJ2_1771 [Streptococcus parauberis KRS-02109]QBX09909.1 hypothetical protein JavanS397_0011 [Streptococcus satellite phage Javan397]